MKQDIPYFDAHCDTVSTLQQFGWELAGNPGHIDLRRCGEYAKRAQIFAVFVPGSEPDCEARSQAKLDYFFRQAEKNRDLVQICKTAADAERAFAAKKTAAFLAVEGAEQLGCDENKLEKAYEIGVRYVTVTWNFQNLLSGSNGEGTDVGLTERGKRFVRKCSEIGMMIDVSHISEPGFWDCMETAALYGGRVIASHSNSKAICPHKRNLTDPQFRALVSSGGIVGINLYSDFLGENPDVNTIWAHIEHFLSLGGEHAVAIGADFDGCDKLPRGFHGSQDMGILYEYLLSKKLPEHLVQDIFFHNLMRMFQ